MIQMTPDLQKKVCGGGRVRAAGGVDFVLRAAA